MSASSTESHTPESKMRDDNESPEASVSGDMDESQESLQIDQDTDESVSGEGNTRNDPNDGSTPSGSGESSTLFFVTLDRSPRHTRGRLGSLRERRRPGQRRGPAGAATH